MSVPHRKHHFLIQINSIGFVVRFKLSRLIDVDCRKAFVFMNSCVCEFFLSLRNKSINNSFALHVVGGESQHSDHDGCLRACVYRVLVVIVGSLDCLDEGRGALSSWFVLVSVVE